MYMKFLKEYGPYIVILIVVLIVKTYIITPIAVNGDSMFPTLEDKDIMILRKYDKKIERFDIVVVSYNHKYLIKRVIGMPGELIKYEDNKLYVNGEYIEEDFLDKATTNDFEFKIPQEYYFVMGDNREISYDSRSMGAFSINKILGKTNYTFYPFQRIGNKN